MVTDGSLADIANSAGPLALAVSVDEEGGRISQLSDVIGSALPSPRVMAQQSTPDEVYRKALDRGRKMRSLGITIDFAPVVDVTAAPADTVIGDRSFSADPAVVTKYAGAYARGLRDAGVLPVLKHFPGHGHASGDSHLVSVVTPPLAELQKADLVPYRSLVAESPVGVMMGHMQVPGLTGSDPASLSPAAVSLLRTGTGVRRAAVRRAGVHRRPVEHAIDQRPLQRRRGRAAGTEGRRRHCAVDRHGRSARGSGPAGIGGRGRGALTMARVDASVLRMAAVKGLNPRCGR
jgi:beta-N-acetylhexosaminidase